MFFKFTNVIHKQKVELLEWFLNTNVHFCANFYQSAISFKVIECFKLLTNNKKIMLVMLSEYIRCLKNTIKFFLAVLLS